jgi:hypothetical protein
MPEVTSHQHGVPSWVDIGTADVPAALQFYGDLFGWEGEDMGEETGHYTIVSKGGRMVGAISGAEDPGPPRWSTYINVDDVDAVQAKAEAAGATVVMPPSDVMTAGRMAVYQDPTGAYISTWQPRDHPGAQVVNEPGALIWNELSTSDPAAAQDFYGEVFGWGWGGSDQYHEAQVSGRTIAGVMPRPAEMPGEVPDHWLVYFGSADVDADAARAAELGATVLVPPVDVPGTGRFSVLADPQGAMFGLFKG